MSKVHVLTLVILVLGNFLFAQSDKGIEKSIIEYEQQFFGYSAESEILIRRDHLPVNNTFDFVPVYSAQVNNEFWPNSYTGATTQLSVAFGDLDADGDLDLVQGSRYRMEWVQNIGTPQVSQWDSLALGNLVPSNNKFWTPELVDIDNDNDLDLFCGTLQGPLSFWENIGDSLYPVWGSEQINYGGFAPGWFSRPVFCDIDDDHDYDLIIGSDGGILHFYLNTGTSENPDFKLQSGSLVNTGTSNSVYPEFVDIDADSDSDLFVGTEWGTISFYRNTGKPDSAQWNLETNRYENISLSWSHLQPRFEDIDGDQDMDMFITDLNGFFYLYRNNGTKNQPVWHEETNCYNKILNFGRPSAPAAGDIDGDGDIDIIMGTHNIFILKNTGTAQTPEWEWEGTSAVNFNSFWVVPELADVDGDQDLDLFVGTNSGDLYHYENTGTPQSPFWSYRTGNYTGINFSSNDHVSAAFADIDNDTDLDMFVQHFACDPCRDSIDYYQNTGTSTMPLWSLIDNNYMNIGSYGISFGTCDFGDLDNDDDLDCLLGDNSGNFYYFENIGIKDSAEWSYQGIIGPGIEGNEIYSTPVLTDLNGDGWLDIISGTNSGGINLLWNNSGSTDFVEDKKEKIIPAFSLFQNYPNPFNPVTTIRYQLPKKSDVLLSIYNSLGQKITILVNEQQPAGYYSVNWNAGNLSSGVYFYRIEAESFSQIKKMLLIK